jgi:hypothetical protein
MALSAGGRKYRIAGIGSQVSGGKYRVASFGATGARQTSRGAATMKSGQSGSKCGETPFRER